MQIKKLALAAVLVGLQIPGFPLLADSTTEQLEALKKQIEQLSRKVQDIEQQETRRQAAQTPPLAPPAADSRFDQLDQQVRILERKQELEEEAGAEKAKQAARVSIGSSGFAVRSPDSNYVFRVRGYFQAGARYALSDRVDTTVNDTFLMRRVRPIFDGTVAEKFDYRVMLDFGAQQSISSANHSLLQDAYVTARLWPELQIQAGKMKEPVGLERLQSGANLLFVERAYPTQLVPNRDLGLQLQGDLFGGALRYEAGVFNGVADGGSGDFETTDNDKDFAGRLFAHPFKHTGSAALQGLGIGVAGTYGSFSGTPRSYLSAGLQKFFSYRSSTSAAQPNVLADGDQWRIAPQVYYYAGPFGLQGEWVLSSQNVRQAGGGLGAGQSRQLANSAWQVAASWFVTGEENSFKPVAPKRPLNFHGDGWGALELVARVTQLNVDDAAFPIYADPAKSAKEALAFSVGLNWHLNRNVKLSLDYDHTEFDAASGNPYATRPEDMLLTQVQVSF